MPCPIPPSRSPQPSQAAISTPNSADRPPANLQSTRIRARTVASVTSSPPSAILAPSIGGFGLRDADQAAARIDLVSRLSGAMGSDLGTVAIIGLILKTTNSQLYRDVSKGIISDDEIVNSILGTLFADVRDFVELDRLSALKVFVEATIIAASAPPVRAIIDQQPRANLEEVFRSRSERLSGYVRKLAEHDTGSNFLPAGDHRNLETVLRISYETWNTLSTEDERPALVRAAAMLELLAG